ncbi:MAG: tetratricopeptide repeat protein [Acidobacteria bacterium]|nr:tetratricopeptide repeat protein [Acidobacteriota bacterium]
MALLPSLVLLALLQSGPATEGRKALEANNFALAAELYQKAVAADPKDWASRFHLGLALSLLNKDAEAVQAYRKVLEAQPNLYEAQLNLGILLLRQKAADEALKLLTAAVQQKPKEYRPNYYHGEALASIGNSAGAETAYRKALEVQPASAEAQVGLARALAKQNRLGDAEPLYRQAAQSDPEFRRALLELAGLLEQAKQQDKAVEIYRQFPEDAAARERLGELLLEGGKALEAIPELEKSYQASPTNANRLALATAYLRSKQAQKALPLLQQAVNAEPEDLQLRLYYGRALRDQRSFQAAAAEFFKATQLKQDSKESWSELAGMLILLENYTQAIKALDNAHALGGETTAYWYFRALCFDHLKDYKQALPSYEKFLALSVNKNPDEEFKARQRIRVIQKELSKR